MSMKPIRARGVIIDLDMIRVALGFPADCEIKWIGMDEAPWHCKVRIESPSFPEVQVNERIPVFVPSFKLIGTSGWPGKPELDSWGEPT